MRLVQPLGCVVLKDIGLVLPLSVVPKDTGLASLRYESQKVLTDVQVLFGALMNNISNDADMTIYNMKENLRETEMKLFAQYACISIVIAYSLNV